MPMAFDDGSTDEDAALLVRYASGDHEAARLLLARLTPMLLSLAQRMLGDRAEAEDVVQEAMLKLWRQAPDWQPGRARVSTWAYRVAANLCTDRLRRRLGQPLDGIAEPEDDRPSVEAQLMGADRQTALQVALDGLPERQRLAIVLRHIEGRSNPEIATVLDVSVEAVESLLARGRRGLASALVHQRGALGLTED
ncbi:RNA polymerase sigma factor [Oceanomicrobium pacificus]|uniref:RNA polymerase sigma factor n=1 Tax=Oceanomicrobium pacificus TaxID=2692916 RepID=A0A6B0TY48_9RHOB|nr:RNA polymerase sigma factor [Oceanomicrobium pacificus]MXU63841.1 RNA polymerase sigma factor [Oceanomicrobium pacificus]